MHRNDYEQKRQSLDRQLDAGIELLRSAHRTQVRALDLLWMMSPENTEPQTALLELIQPAEVAPRLPSPPSLQAPPARKRSRPGEALAKVISALALLPEVFDRRDLVAVLEPPIERTTLTRTIETLCYEGSLGIEGERPGFTPTRFRKLAGTSHDN
jgi:hypothetical protein